VEASLDDEKISTKSVEKFVDEKLKLLFWKEKEVNCTKFGHDFHYTFSSFSIAETFSKSLLL